MRRRVYGEVCEGDWKIVCKLFAHTDGEPPEGI
jgi:hypothetical protein